MIKKFVPTHAKEWTRPDSYVGTTYEGYYCGLGRGRDSDILSNSNFESMLEKLGGEKAGVIVTRASHWGCGWVEQILVKKTAYKKLKRLDQLLKNYDDYPVIDQDDFSERECQVQEDQLEYHNDEFREKVLKFAGWKDEENPDFEQLDSLIRGVYLEDGGYCGVEDAWVSEGAITRFLECYEGKLLAKKNYYAAACKQVLRKVG